MKKNQKKEKLNNFWQKLWSLLAPSQRKIITFLVLLVVVEFVSMIAPYLLKIIIDKIITFNPEEFKQIILLILLIFLVDHGNSLMYFFKDRLGIRIIVEVKNYISVYVQRVMVMLPLSFHEKESTGSKLSKTERGVVKIENMLTNLLWQVVPTFVQLTMTTVVLFIADYKIGLSIIFFVPIFIIITLKGTLHLRPVRIKRYRDSERAAGVMGQSIMNINTVKSFVQEKNEIGRYKRLMDSIKNNEMKEWFTSMNYEFARNMVVDTGRTVVLLLGVILVLKGQLSIGTFVFVITLSEKAYSSLFRLSSIYDRVEEAREAVNRLVELIEEDSDVKNPENGIKPTELKGDISFENINFSYNGNGKKALKNVDFKIASGEMTAFVGQSGGGKTTTARMIYRHYDPQLGAVKIDGIDLRDYDLYAFRRFISIVPQEVEIFNGSIRDNIAYAKPSATESEVLEVAKISNSLEFINKFDDGFKTEVGERGVRLSGGQRQRIGIARAILADPRILIFDEATSSLDSYSEKLIQDAMDRIIKDRTVIVIAHRLSTIQKANKIIVFEEGGIVEEGNHSELVGNKKGLYSRLTKLQNLGELS